MRHGRTPLILAAIFLLPCSTPRAEGRISAIEALPASVRALFVAACPADSWIGNKRRIGGSASKRLSDGKELFLMVCGDAASTVPFTAIVLSPSGEAAEARLYWTLDGHAHQGSFSNARFGSQRDTVVSTAHSSASCTPRYTHRWDGIGLELIGYDGTGCERE